ncbi:MAG TPA: alkane 1-monooxygenase [Chitinophagales bacterium]|nr:alkane 1-monooxygenase [Chitinophagales bacterium]HRP40106.1 alkane 1-monooxygenase [Chitinophagales bacterium]
MNYRFLKFLSPLLSVVAIFVSLLAGGAWTYFSVFYAFFLIPFMELFMNGTEENMNKQEEELAKKDIGYDIVIWLIVPVQLAIMALFFYQISQPNLLWHETLGMILSFGLSCGVFGINVAHELGHRNTKHEQVMAKILLWTTQYMHFFIEHNRGHHKNVSTDNDPASSRYGETLYAFYFRTITGSWLSAWHLERERLAKSNTSFWSLKNEMLVYQIIQVSTLVIIGVAFGLKILLLYMAAALTGALMLETVNYIEHYGLRRKKVDDAYYEKVMPIHSWNSNHPIGRLMLFELTRHSDHHYMPSRKYQILRHFDQSPQMPTGYPGMMVLATIPPLWFKVMHKQIEKYKATQLGEALA